MSEPQRLFSLDVLRGLAILLVLVLHFPPATVSVDGLVEEGVTRFASVGWVGVDLFFVLSGFLISGLIYKEYDRTGGFDALRFWLRRGFKIWPAYFAAYGGMTAARIAWEWLRNDDVKAAGILESAVCNALFLQNYLACERWSQSWSLAVEEHFYTVFALLAGVTCWLGARSALEGRKAFAFLVPMFVLVAVAVLWLRWNVVSADYVVGSGVAYYRSHLRIDSLLFGVFLGYLMRYRPGLIWPGLVRWPAVCVALVSALLWPTIWPKGETPYLESLGFSLIYLSFGVVVASAARNPGFGWAVPVLGRCLFRPLAWLGLYSYTVYLGHAVLFGVPGVETLRRWLLGHVDGLVGPACTLWLDRFGYLAASILLGVLLSHLVERPFLRLRERVLPSQKPLPQGAPA